MLVHLPAEHGCQDEIGLLRQAIFGTKSARLAFQPPYQSILRDRHKVKSEVAAQGVTSQMTDE
jgi:hypothetical protein